MALEMADTETTTPVEDTVDSGSAPTPAKVLEAESLQAHEPVLGPIEDELFGRRIRKSFGSRAFWGTIVTSYVVGQGVFYKVSFDDGDVDIVSTTEVQSDHAAAERYADEDPAAKKSDVERPEATEVAVSSSATSTYVDLLRTKRSSLKRPRDNNDSENNDEDSSTCAWEVKLWSLRLFATIMEEEGYIRLHEFVKMPNGQPGEMESTGRIKPGDALVAVQGRIVHGRMDHTQACDLIRAAPRPVTLTFVRPPQNADSTRSDAVAAAIEAIEESSTSSINVVRTSDTSHKKPRVEKQRVISSSLPMPATTTSSKSGTTQPAPAPSTIVAISRDHDSQSQSPAPQARSREYLSPGTTPPNAQGQVSVAVQPMLGKARTPSPPVDISTFAVPSPGDSTSPQVPVSSRDLPHHRLQRTPSPAPPVDDPPADSNVHQLSSVMAYQPPRQNSTLQSDSNRFQTVVIPAHLASSTSSHLSSSVHPVVHHSDPRSVSTPMVHSGPHAYHHQQIAPNARQTGLVPAARANYNMIGISAGPGGQHRYNHSTRASFVPLGSDSFHQRNGASFSGRTTTTSIPPLDQTHVGPATAAHDPRFSYIRQMPDSVSSYSQPRGPIPNAPHHPLSSFQRLPVRQGESLSSDDERRRSMTLGDYMVYTAQQERLALQQASEKRAFGNTTRPQPQLASSSHRALEPLGQPASSTGPDKEQKSVIPSVSSAQSSAMTPTPSATNATAASTGTSFLSLEQTSFLEDIPVNVTAKVSRMRNAFRQTTASSRDSPPRPPFLTKYEADGVVEVRITQSRLYLTLVPMGQYVSVSSFVRGDMGEVGEIEVSGKVLVGDVLVGVGSVEIPSFMSPAEVASIVNSQSRPYSVYFIRATWEMLE